LHVRARSGRTDAQALDEMLDALAQWVRGKARSVSSNVDARQ
jgi:hypothetical protein